MATKPIISMTLAFILLLSGCAPGSLICRHKAMAHYAWAVEERLDRPEFVLFTTTPIVNILVLGIYNAHVQATVRGNDGRRLWINGFFTAKSNPGSEFPLGKFCWVMDLTQYVEWLAVNRELSTQPYVEQQDWPKCSDLK